MMSTAKTKEDLYQSVFKHASDGILVVDLESNAILVANPAAAQMHGYTLQTFTGMRVQRLIHAKSLPFFANYAQVINQGGLLEMTAQHQRWDDSLFSVEWRAVLCKFKERNCALAILRDVSKRVLAERQLQERVGTRAHEQSALLEISQTLASTLDIKPGLILEQLAMVVQYSHGALFKLEDSDLLILAVRGTTCADKTVPLRIPMSSESALKKLLAQQQPVRIADLNSKEPTAKSLQTLLAENYPALLEGVQGFMWVPLAVKNRIIGGIGIAHAQRNAFTAHHAELAMTIANQAGLTLVNAELYEHAQELAILQERQRLAQNLHDAVNQSLFSAGIIAEVLPRLWDKNPDEARRSLEDLRRLTRGAQAEMRALLAELHPASLIDADLGELLQLLGNAFTGRTNIPVQVTVEGEDNLPADAQVAFYHICQEALMNIAKHAQASQVNIEVSHNPEGLQINIRDNGCGFDPSAAPPGGHYGLGMMRERAEAVGATLTLVSKPGVGTQVIIRWIREMKNERR
jgi:PAS domain S-box-containing protein